MARRNQSDAALLVLGARVRRQQLMEELEDLDARFPTLRMEDLEDRGVEPEQEAPPPPPSRNGRKPHMSGVALRMSERWKARQAAKTQPADEQEPPLPLGEPAASPAATIPLDAPISVAILYALADGPKRAAGIVETLKAAGWNNTANKKGVTQLVGVTLSRMKNVVKTVKKGKEEGTWELAGPGRVSLQQDIENAAQSNA